MTDFKKLLEGRYELAYVLSGSLAQYRDEAPDKVLEDICRTGEEEPEPRKSFKVSDGDMDVRITIGTGDDLRSGRLSSKLKAVCCGSYVMSEVADEDCKVCSVWFQDEPVPSRAGTADRFPVKSLIVDGTTGRTREIPVDVVVVYRGSSPSARWAVNRWRGVPGCAASVGIGAFLRRVWKPLC